MGARFMVCFHAGRRIGEAGSVAEARDMAYDAYAQSGRAVNVYPVDDAGKVGLRAYEVRGGRFLAYQPGAR
jgi:hypothetical protein